MPADYSIWSTVLGIAAFLAVLILSCFGLRWISKRTMGASSGNMRVIERLPIGQGTFLLLVQVGGRLLTLSSTKDGLKYLCELSPDDINADGGQKRQADDEEVDNSTFLRRFAHNMRIQSGLLPKDTPPARPAERKSEEPSSEAAAFLSALQRAQELQAELREQPSVFQTTNPSPVPVQAEDSGRDALTDYNKAIESMKQLGRMERPASAPQAEYTQPVRSNPPAQRTEPTRRPEVRYTTPEPDDYYIQDNPQPARQPARQPEPPAGYSEPVRTAAPGTAAPRPAAAEASRFETTRFETPSPAQSDTAPERPVRPVSYGAAAAVYKSSSTPISQGYLEDYEEQLLLERKEEPDADASAILEALKEQRQIRVTEAAAEEVFDVIAPKMREQRESAARKVLADDSRVDELFSRISKRSGRYAKKE